MTKIILYCFFSLFFSLFLFNIVFGNFWNINPDKLNNGKYEVLNCIDDNIFFDLKKELNINTVIYIKNSSFQYFFNDDIKINGSYIWYKDKKPNHYFSNNMYKCQFEFGGNVIILQFGECFDNQNNSVIIECNLKKYN